MYGAYFQHVKENVGQHRDRAAYSFNTPNHYINGLVQDCSNSSA